MLLVLALLLGSLAGAGSADSITVSAAVSLTEALEEVARAYRAAGGGPVALNLAGSNVLARQIVSGAPVDVFISADAAQMDVVDKAGLVVPGSRLPVAGNRLAVVVAARRVSVPRSIQDLAADDVRRIAIGDPAAVPAGVYARGYLERVGLWPRLERKVVPTSNVRGALAAVQQGSADAAIVYDTDARIASGVRVALRIDGPDSPRIVYPACVVGSTKRRADAERFLRFLQTAEATEILKRHGFVSPVPGP
jgi:molybdate transport system substrate-binding protein